MEKSGQITKHDTSLSMPVIDLGCGDQKWPGAFGVDQTQIPGVDLVWDLLEFPYPFQSGSAEKILSRHTLEHFDPEDALRMLSEIYRILKPGGILYLVCPHALSPGAMEHPTHKSHWTFRSFDWLHGQHPGSYYVANSFHFDFEPIEWKSFINLWARWDNPPRWKQLLNAALTRSFNFVLAHSVTLPDLLVKSLPFYRVDIAVTFRKVG